MKKAFTMIEMVFVVVMLGVMAAVSVMYIPQTKLQQAADHMIHNIKYTKSLAQTDDRFFAMKDGSINNYSDTQAQYWKAGMWQVQFHLNGNTTKHSYSIYADTARSANTTNFDGRPMSGDLIAKDPQNKACLSGYSENNLPNECKNNIAKEVRLQETYDVTIDDISPSSCKENNTARIYFDNTGMPYCGAVNISGSSTTLPKRLDEAMKITLKRQKQTATICVSKSGLIYGSNNGICDK
ncbi:MAG: prepilin-type N-terminal cleavage/methylation domain-containing protein [Helicobacteraceae bacterium]|nr:prepilin-type N-terminal cleavage/methylation domain-containing protein [Helicobacteraceae bacterium]